MTDKIEFLLEGGEQELARVAAEIEQKRAELASLEQEQKSWQDFLAKARFLTLHQANGKPPVPGKHLADAPHVKKGSLVHAAIDAIRKNGGVATLDDLVAELEANGRATAAKDFRNVLNSALWRRRNDVFMKTIDGYKLLAEDFDFED